MRTMITVSMRMFVRVPVTVAMAVVAVIISMAMGSIVIAISTRGGTEARAVFRELETRPDFVDAGILRSEGDGEYAAFVHLRLDVSVLLESFIHDHHLYCVPVSKRQIALGDDAAGRVEPEVDGQRLADDHSRDRLCVERDALLSVPVMGVIMVFVRVSMIVMVMRVPMIVMGVTLAIGRCGHAQ